MKIDAKIIGGIVLLLALAGVVFYATKDSALLSPQATSTPVTTTNPDGTPVVVQQPQTTPGAPSAVTGNVVSPTDTTAVVSGTVVPNGALTTYWYEFGATANLGNKTISQSVGSGYAQTSAPMYITGLTKGTNYFYRLLARNQYETTAGETHSFKTMVGTPAPVGSSPSVKSLAATGVTRTSANIKGEVTPNKVATQYWFEYGTTANLGNTTPLTSAGSGSAKSSVSASLPSLTPATTYYFRLNAQNQFGTVNGEILNFKTSGPAVSVLPIVTTQVASPVATTSVTVRGTVHPNSAATTYWFEYSDESPLGSIVPKTTAHKSAGSGGTTVSVQADLSSLRSDTTYNYRIVAQNSAGTVRGEAFTFKTK